MGAATTIQRFLPRRQRRLTQNDIDRYLTAVGTQLPLLAEEREELLARLRRWAEADDGKPVYMLNLMRYYDPPRAYPGAPTDFSGTAEQANAHYERGVTPLVLRCESYPLLTGRAQGTNLTPSAPEFDEWNRVLLMRYPSRRAFLDLLADPAYAKLWPYKAMAVQLVLLPVSGDLVLPELKAVAAGAAISLLLGVGWLRSALNNRGTSEHQGMPGRPR